MAALTIQDASAGLAGVTLGAANSGGDTVAAGTRAGGWDLPVVLVVLNSHTGAQTVTVGGTAYEVAQDGGIALIPVRGGGKYGTSVAITYSGVTALTIGACRLNSPLA